MPTMHQPSKVAKLLKREITKLIWIVQCSTKIRGHQLVLKKY